MQITKGFKFQNREFGSKAYEVTVSHSELGLKDPTSIAEFRNVHAELNLHVEGLVLLEEHRRGLIDLSQHSINEQLKPWLDAQTQSGTAPQSPNT